MKPKISVIIAAYNEEKLLSKCLKSLEQQTYPKENYEVIVVDNNSLDATGAIARQFTTRVFFYDKIQGCSAARKYGSVKAKGSIIVFFDADCLAKPDWLAKINSYLCDSELVSVGGPAIPDKKTFFTTLIFAFYNFFFYSNNFFRIPLFWGFNSAVKKNAYDQVGGLNENLQGSEDWELSMRLKKAYGMNRIKYVQDLQVITSTRKQSDFKTFYKYSVEGIKNYVNIVILKRVKSHPVFNIR